MTSLREQTVSLGDAGGRGPQRQAAHQGLHWVGLSLCPGVAVGPGAQGKGWEGPVLPGWRDLCSHRGWGTAAGAQVQEPGDFGSTWKALVSV